MRPNRVQTNKDRRHHVRMRTGAGATWHVSKEASDISGPDAASLYPSAQERQKNLIVTVFAAAAFCISLLLASALCDIGIEWCRNGIGSASISSARPTPGAVNSAESLNEQGMQLVAQHKYREAIDCFNKAIAKEPKMIAAHNNLALTHMQAGNYRAACATLEKAIAIQPNNQYTRDALNMLKPRIEKERVADSGKDLFY